MEWTVLFALVVLIAVFAGLVRNYPPDALIVGGVVVFALAGIISPEQAFRGFSNTGMLTVAALYVVTAGLRETGALDILGGWLLRGAKTERGVFTRMVGSVTGVSAFLNNTPVVAMFIPVLNNWCRRNRVSASRLLLPLSYLSILGGTCTLIGTSTNLVVNGLMTDAYTADPEKWAQLEPMTMFEIGRAGVPYAIIGVLYLYFVGRKLIPERKDFLMNLGDTAREYLANMRVDTGCPLVGQNVEAAGLRHLDGLFLVEIIREGNAIAPVTPEEIVQEGDTLTFTGVVENIMDLERTRGLTPIQDDPDALSMLSSRTATLCEAVVSNSSPLIGKGIRDSNFRSLYNAAVIAVSRGGQRLKGRVGDIVLREGDTLLLRVDPHFAAAHRNDPDFFLVSSIEDSSPVRHERALLALGLTALLVFLLSSGFISTVMAAFLVAGLMVLTRCVSVSQARQSVDLRTLVTIAAAFGFGAALEESGLVAIIADGVVNRVDIWGPIAVLIGVYLVTSLFTEVVTNNAAAAIMFPFVLSLSQLMEVSPRPFVIVIALAASASFVTPLGYQTNLMVYGPGGYKFTDFVRVGLPLNILLMITAALIVPVMWPFHP